MLLSLAFNIIPVSYVAAPFITVGFLALVYWAVDCIVYKKPKKKLAIALSLVASALWAYLFINAGLL